MEQADTFYHQLKQLRIAQGITLEDIAAKTRVNIRFLEALEAGEFDILPMTYIRLFLRSYCRGIGADEEETLQHLEELVGEPEDQRTTPYDGADVPAMPATDSDVALESAPRGPARLRRDFLTGAAIFLFLILVTFLARRVYQEPTSSGAAPSFPTGTQNNPPPPIGSAEPPAEAGPATAQSFRQSPAASPATTPPLSAGRSPSLVPEESVVELPDELFAEDRIVSHHLKRVLLTPPVRLTLRARDNVVILPIINGREGTSINLTVAEARIWTIQNQMLLRTTAIDHLRGDLNGVPIDLGDAIGLGVLRVTSSGEYEVFAYADTAR
ncbi:MAG: helix-turn-helix domain-containing protein [Candidatus Neomarinimicrobiota bacterium]